MLLADQRRSQHMVDAAVEDHDVLPARDLAVDDASDVGAGRPDQEATRLQQDPRAARGRVPGEARRDVLQPTAEEVEVEWRLVGLVRDPEPPARVDEPQPEPGRRREPGGQARQSTRRGPRSLPASSTLDAPKAWMPSGSSHGDATASAAATRRSATSIPNLPAPSSPTSRTRSSRALSVTAARSSTGCAPPEALGDRRQPPQLADATRRSPHERPPRRRRPAPRRASRVRSRRRRRRRSRRAGPGAARRRTRRRRPSPTPASWRRTARLGFALTAYARSTDDGSRRGAPSTWRATTSRS